MADRTVRALIEILKADGWVRVDGGKGSHRKFKHPTKQKPVIVSGHSLSDEVGVGLWNKILKDARLK